MARIGALKGINQPFRPFVLICSPCSDGPNMAFAQGKQAIGA